MTSTITDKTFGALYGYAIGDALGLGTEFMVEREIDIRYPGGLHTYGQIIRDAHRSQWKPGEWTNDTEVVLMSVESIIANKGLVYTDIARRMKEWYLSRPIDVTHNLHMILREDDYVSDPLGSSRRVWESMEKFEATSECLGRAMVAGMWNGDLKKDTVDICHLTHFNTRCEACCLVVARLAQSLLWEESPATFDELESIANAIDPDVVRYLENARHGTLREMRLDDEDTLWFVRKGMASALWAFWHCDSPKEGLEAVISMGGDADTNGAIANGLLGLKYGFKGLDKNLVDGLVGKARLHRDAEVFATLLINK